jgi:integral membrane sensor domain MASE1
MKRIARSGFVAIAYYLSAQLGLQLELINSQVTPLWPPTGIALVAMLIFGLRVWPGVALGALAVNMSISTPLFGDGIVLFGNTYAPATAGLITIGNTLAPLAAAMALRKLHFRLEIDRVRDALSLIFPAALGCMMISATFGAGTLALAGTADFMETWIVWWTGDAMGVLLVTPVLLLFRRARWPATMPLKKWPGATSTSTMPFKRWPEAALMVTVTAGVTVVGGWHEPHMLFLVFPVLMWAATRYQVAGAAVCALVSSVVATTAASTGGGTFSNSDLWNVMLVLQTFNGALTITALLCAALMEERNAALWQVVRGNKDLCDMVGFLSHGRLTEDQVHELEDIANNGDGHNHNHHPEDGHKETENS